MRYRNLWRYTAVLLVILGGLWLFGPREPASLSLPNFDIAAPSGLDTYLAAREAVFDDIVPGTEKSIVWANKRDTKTDIAIVYIHGFSASAMELQPLPNRVATALGANLFFTRLTGHGRGSIAMQTASVASWMKDMAEALAIGRRLGHRTIIIATSTGGTLAAAAALDAAGITADMLLQVHDELIFEAPQKDCEALIKTVKTTMENACAPRLSLTVPLLVDAQAANNWEEAH